MKTATINRADFVNYYHTLSKLFEDIDPEFLDSLTGEERDDLDGICAYEDYAYIAINEDTIIVIMYGEASSIHTLKEFEELTRKVLRDRLEEEA